MIRYRHALSALSLIICFATAARGAPSPVATPIRSVLESSVATPLRPSPASPTATLAVSPSPVSSASPAAALPVATNRASVISYLGQVIGWYRVAIAELAVRDPNDILYAADHRQLADSVLHLGFDYARAQAVLLKAMGSDKQLQPMNAQSAVAGDLVARRATAEIEVAGFTAKVD